MKNIRGEKWVITAKTIGMRPYFVELWGYRQLVSFLSLKILEKQYQRSILGRLWIILRPILTVVMYSVLFGVVFRVETDSVPFLVFLIQGLTVWTTFDRSLSWGTRSLETVRGIMKKVYFPRLLIPIAGQISGVIDLAIMLMYLAFAGVYYGLIQGTPVYNFSLELFGAAIAIALVFYLSLALSLWTSVFDVIGRDMRYSLRYVMQVWMFCTPVMYPVERLPAEWRWVMQYNPMTPLVVNFRSAWNSGQDVVWLSFVFPFFFASLIAAAGVWFFLQFEGETIDAI